MTLTAKTNAFAKTIGFHLPIPAEFIKVAVARRSAKGRPTSLWNNANKGEDRYMLYIIFYVATILDLEVDHHDPHSNGGSYHVSNLRLLPKFLNRGMGNKAFSNERLNQFIANQLPEDLDLMGIPAGFKVLPAVELIKSGAWQAWM